MIFVSLAISIAVYEAMLALLGEPYTLSGGRVLRKLHANRIRADPFLLPPVYRLLTALSPFLYLQKGTEARKNRELQRLHLPYDARTYTLRGLLILLLGGLLSLLALTFSQLLAFALFCLTIFAFLKHRDLIEDGLRGQEEAVRRELPSFADALLSGLSTDRDLLEAVRRYLPGAGPGLREDLAIFLANASYGSLPGAISSLQRRLTLPEGQQLCSILLHTEEGLDQRMALLQLSSQLKLKAREARKRQLALRPAKVRRAMLPAFALAVISMFYVFFYSAFLNMQVLFT